MERVQVSVVVVFFYIFRFDLDSGPTEAEVCRYVVC